MDTANTELAHSSNTELNVTTSSPVLSNGSETELSELMEKENTSLACAFSDELVTQPALSQNNSQATSESSSIQISFDIGYFTKHTASDYEKFKMLTCRHLAPVNPPWKKHGTSSVTLSQRHLDRAPCMAYSSSLDGLFCVPCVFFAKSVRTGAGKGRHQELGQLVTVPCKYYNRLYAGGYIDCHLQKQYHLLAQAAAAAFLEAYSDPSKRIDCILDSSHARQVQQNRSRLGKLIKTIIFMGRQNIPFRAHREPNTDMSTTSPDFDLQGNFRALLDFRIDAGDAILEDHLRDASRNANYLSPQIQNEIIHCISSSIKEKIINRVQQAKYFSILADETADISKTEQMCVLVRYLYRTDIAVQIREDLLSLVDLQDDLTGKGISDQIISVLAENHLDPRNVVGLGFDGASSMSGKYSGAQALMAQSCPHAHYVHCASHCLNLVLAKCSEVPAIRNAFGTVSELTYFIRYCSKRKAKFCKTIAEEQPTTNRHSVLNMCETRWIQKQDAIEVFCILLPSLNRFLEEIAESRDPNGAARADMFLAAIRKPTFLVSLAVMRKIFSLSKIPAVQLQKEDSEILDAFKLISTLLQHIQACRENSEISFTEIYQMASTMAQAIDSEITIHRLAPRQVNRPNIEKQTAENYFRISLFIPALDNFISHLETRFSNAQSVIENLSILLPSAQPSNSKLSILSLASKYLSILPAASELEVQSEFELWRKFCENIPNKPKNAIESMRSAKNFPTILALLSIFATIPVTTASAERVFSSLGRIKTKFRSSMSESRVEGLLLLKTHRDILISQEEIIDRFASMHHRRLNFAL